MLPILFLLGLVASQNTDPIEDYDRYSNGLEILNDDGSITDDYGTWEHTSPAISMLNISPMNNGPTHTTVAGIAVGFTCLFVFIALTWTLLIYDLATMRKKNNEDLAKVI